MPTDDQLKLMPEVEYLSYGVVEERGWGLYDEDIFEKADRAGVPEEDYGTVSVSEEETVLNAAEREELGWSLKCLKGRCGRCSAVVVDGDVDMDAEQEFLTQEEAEDRNICLPCVTKPEDDLKLVYGVRELDSLRDRVK